MIDSDHRHRPCVLVFAGLDPSGGAGIQADIQAISAAGAHALPVVTTLTVQDNDRVQAIHPVDAGILQAQVGMLREKIPVAAVKIGITGSAENVAVIAEAIRALRAADASLPVVLDPVLASGHGDALSRADPVQLLQPLLSLTTLLTPNLPEAVRLCDGEAMPEKQAQRLLQQVPQLLIKGGHGATDTITNTWFSRAGTGSSARSWQWSRLPGGFHGSGCTLASAIAGRLACGLTIADAIDQAQIWVQQALASAYAIADGQKIPQRAMDCFQETS